MITMEPLESIVWAVCMGLVSLLVLYIAGRVLVSSIRGVIQDIRRLF